MKWLKRLGILVIILIVLFVGISFLLPGEFHVEREIVVQAAPAQVHHYVGHLENWPDWGPWEEDDPSIVTTLGETTTGAGAHQSWTGDSGSGELTFTSCDPATGVRYDMSFDEGKYPSSGALLYAAVADGTKVTWTMDGKADGILGRYFGVLVEPMVGPMYERGLEKLKQLAEALPPPAPEPVEEEPAEAAAEEAGEA